MTERRLALDYMSPLPPVRSGIADYSADLLPHLVEEADVRIAPVPSQTVDPELIRRYPVIEGFEDHGSERLVLYQVGNNAYHDEIVERARQRPSVVTLHDVWLHHLLMEQTLARRDLDGYVAALEADHGWIGRAVALPTRWGAYGQAGVFALPAHRRLLERQRGVLLHSEWGRSVLAEEGIETPAFVVPMPMPAPELDRTDRTRFRRRFGIPDDALVLGSYGFQTPIKRTEVAVRALADERLSTVQLLVVGEQSPALDLDRTAREAGVRDRVHLLGFVPKSDLNATIAACDLCVNLRYPTAGETSASLLRVLALGRAAVVSQYGQFAELPAEVAVQCPLEAVAEPDEPTALAARVAAIASHPNRLLEMGAAARRLVVERHEPRAAARAIVAACREIASLPPRTTTPEPFVAAPPTSLTWGALAGSLVLEGACGWQPGERRELTLHLHNRSPARWLAGRSGAGGVAVEVRFEPEAGAPVDRWVALPRTVEPGAKASLPLRLRRPLEATRLHIVPHVLAAESFDALGGPVLQLDL